MPDWYPYAALFASGTCIGWAFRSETQDAYGFTQEEYGSMTCRICGSADVTLIAGMPHDPINRYTYCDEHGPDDDRENFD